MVVTQSAKGFFVYFDYSIVFLAIIANCITLSVVVRARFSLSGYRRFLISLAASDLYVCCVNVLTMLYNLYATTIYPESGSTNGKDASGTTLLQCGPKILRTLQLAGFFASLLNIVGMSIDHFFGIVYPMNYRDLMNKNAARFAVGAIWFTSFLLAFLDIPITMALYKDFMTTQPTMAPAFIQIEEANYVMPSQNRTTLRPHRNRRERAVIYRQVGTTNDDGSSMDDFDVLFKELESYDEALNKSNTTSIATPSRSERFRLIFGDDLPTQASGDTDICTFFSVSKMWFDMCVIALALFCFAFLTVCYGVILKKVSERMDAGRKTTRKLIFTTVILLSAFMICWIPFMAFEFSMLIIFRSGSEVSANAETESLLAKSFYLHSIFSSLLMCYPLIDPIIYAARIPAVQQAILVHCIKFCPSCCRCSIRYLNSTNRQSVSRLPHLANKFANSIIDGQPVLLPNLITSRLPSINATAVATHANGHAHVPHENDDEEAANRALLSHQRNNSSGYRLHKRRTSYEASAARSIAANEAPPAANKTQIKVVVVEELQTDVVVTV